MRPPQNRRMNTPPKLAAAAISSPITSGAIDSRRVTITLSITSRCSSGIASDANVASSVPPSEISTARGCRQQYPAIRRTQRRSLRRACEPAPASSPGSFTGTPLVCMLMSITVPVKDEPRMRPPTRHTTPRPVTFTSANSFPLLTILARLAGPEATV